MTTIVQGMKCIRLRSYCAVCEDGKYYSPKSQRELSSDLYECATRPRARVFSRLGE
jgi:hypothetical protein